MDTFVNKVVVYKDKLVIFLNSQEEPFVISEYEMEEALLFFSNGSCNNRVGAP